MGAIDLWEGVPVFDYPGEPIPEEVLAPSLTEVITDIEHFDSTKLFIPSGGYTANIYECPDQPEGKSKLLQIDAIGDLRKHPAYPSLVVKSHEKIRAGYRTTLYGTPLNSFVLRHILSQKTAISKTLQKDLQYLANRVPMPVARLTQDGKHVDIVAPAIKYYRDILFKLGAYATKESYRIRIDRAIDLITLSNQPQKSKKPFPKIEIEDEVMKLHTARIPGFTGDIHSLRNVPLGVLNVVASDVQTHKQKKASSTTLAEKFAAIGIHTAYDLLFWFPRRYIDKSNPQDIADLIEGESSTIVGTIEQADVMPGDTGGAKFTIKTANGDTINAIFWRQTWLLRKFTVGTEVLVTGKVKWFRDSLAINGTSIDPADETILMPIVPIYNQSEAKGITTRTIMSASRELLSRLGDFPLPPYLQTAVRKTYSNLLHELHFPTSIANYQQAVDDLAYAELILMQIKMIEDREKAGVQKGVTFTPTSTPNLQNQATKQLPFSLTKDQIQACKTLNTAFEKPEASSSLVVADVGAGKTVVMAIAALRAIDAGYQAVIAAPTDILAQQIYKNVAEITKNISEVSANLLSMSVPAPERKIVKASIKSGETNLLVGTHATLGKSVTYHNLGLVIIDEQQKFGAEQRTALLSSRKDGLVPHTVMSTATPIPRSTAQVFYGDIDIIELHEKPAGRKPIETHWLETHPNTLLDTLVHPIWQDIAEEAKRGNKTFIVTPLVEASNKVDAASVQRTLNSAKQILGSQVRAVHGSMKTKEQQEIMEDFRNGTTNVLVASSIVEVGVDIPDATRVVVLSAERFGASSLHQIRGRVGRSNKHSVCYLVSEGKTKSAQSRLSAMVEHHDGFEIAKVDMATRGQGEIFNTSQSGASEMIFASLAKHGERIPDAITEAQQILGSSFANEAREAAKIRFGSEEINNRGRML